jgi:hypothetical protein
LILILFTGLGAVTETAAQSGGKKREKRVKAKRRGNFMGDRWKSMGHADEFAKGSRGRRNIFTKLFSRSKPAWTYRKTGTAGSNHKANRGLFSRWRSEHRKDDARTQEFNNRERSRNRERGNKVFKFRKHKR